MKKGIFRYGWRVGLGYLWWRWNPANSLRASALYGEDPQWSNHLEALLCFESFSQSGVVDSMHTALLGENMVWIANHPYASFAPYEKMMSPFSKNKACLPSRFVVYLAEQKCRREGIKLNG